MLPLIHPRPHTGLEGKFSMEYVVAAGLLDRAVGLTTFTDEAVQRAAVQDLLRRVTVVEDPDIKIVNNPVDEGYVEVSVQQRDGQHLVERVTYPIGSSEIPLPWNELVAKFRDCAAGALDRHRIEEAVARIDALDQQRTLSELVRALTPA
jgi:2-methylcitrate dehydratase PrpD